MVTDFGLAWAAGDGLGVDHALRPPGRHARLRGPRAGRGARGHRGRRHLRPRRRPLRDGHGPAAVRGRLAAVHRAQALPRGARLARGTTRPASDRSGRRSILRCLEREPARPLPVGARRGAGAAGRSAPPLADRRGRAYGPPPRGPRRRRRWPLAVAAAAVPVDGRAPRPLPRRRLPPRAPRPGAGASVAVLGFKNLSGQPRARVALDRAGGDADRRAGGRARSSGRCRGRTSPA